MNAKFPLTTILNTVCDYYQLEKSDVCSKSRKDELVKARKMFCYFSREFSESSLQKIGDIVGLTHCDVLYLVGEIKSKKKPFNKTKKELYDAYHVCCKNKTDFMLIDCDKEQVRHNFHSVL